MNRFDAVGVGALNVDKLFRVNKIAAAEEESFITDFEETCGGSAANTIVGLARLGCNVGFIGKVGNDKEGRMLVEDFRKEHVNADGIAKAAHGRSGKALGFVDERGERALYVDPGVNDTLDFNEVKIEYAHRTRFMHLASFVGAKSFETQLKLLETLPSEVKVSFDPGVLYAQLGLDKLRPILRKSFVCMPNTSELELITGKSDYCMGAEFLLEIGVRIVAVKMGNRGCYVRDGRETHLIGPFKVKVVDTTGAGDAFCAGFLYGLIKDKNLEECGRIGNFVASRKIMKMGARTGLPTLRALKEKNIT
jgi:ribokinase